jgi:hypothetical protein
MRNISIFSLLLCAAAVPFFGACGGDTSDQTDAGDDGATADETDQSDASTDDVVTEDADAGQISTTYPAFKIDAPQVQFYGGSILVNPKVVPVYFGSDSTTFTAQLTTYLNNLTTTAATYWTPAVGEYGVQPPTITAPVQLSESPGTSPLTDAQIQTWLGQKLSSNDPAWPAPDANTVYALFYPTGTSITLGQGGGTSCSSFGGYHSNIKVGTLDVAYAVMPRCAKFGGLTGVDAVTATTSHELIESSTDPYPEDQNNAGYADVDTNHIIWSFDLGGGEVGDMCAQNPDAFFKDPNIGNYVQRTWSNASAAAGHNPCQPSAGLPYFNSMPVLTDSVSIGGQFTTKGVTIPVGQSKTIEVDLYSDKNTGGAWNVSAIDAAQLQQQPAELSFTWDKTSGQNGQKLYLTVKVLAASQYGVESFIIESQLGGQSSLWVGLVGN